jgi:hypothetical protein
MKEFHESLAELYFFFNDLLMSSMQLANDLWALSLLLAASGGHQE